MRTLFNIFFKFISLFLLFVLLPASVSFRRLYSVIFFVKGEDVMMAICYSDYVIVCIACNAHIIACNAHINAHGLVLSC